MNSMGALGGTRFHVGLSTAVKVVPPAFQMAYNLKIQAGGSSGTVELLNGVSFSSLTGAMAFVGSGYPIGENEIINVTGPAIMYLAASGVTMTMALLPAQSRGVSLNV